MESNDYSVWNRHRRSIQNARYDHARIRAVRNDAIRAGRNGDKRRRRLDLLDIYPCIREIEARLDPHRNDILATGILGRRNAVAIGRRRRDYRAVIAGECNLPSRAKRVGVSVGAGRGNYASRPRIRDYRVGCRGERHIIRLARIESNYNGIRHHSGIDRCNNRIDAGDSAADKVRRNEPVNSELERRTEAPDNARKIDAGAVGDRMADAVEA